MAYSFKENNIFTHEVMKANVTIKVKEDSLTKVSYKQWIFEGKLVLSTVWQSEAFPYIKEAWKAAKLKNKNLLFKLALLILTASTNTFHSSNSSAIFHVTMHQPTA